MPVGRSHRLSPLSVCVSVAALPLLTWSAAAQPLDPSSLGIVRRSSAPDRVQSDGDFSPFRPTRIEPLQYPLAVDGHCVVTLLDRGEWLPGDPRHQSSFDGRQYQFVSGRSQLIFAASPARYAPVLNGDCVVKFVEEGRRIPGSVRFAARYNDRIYLFASEAARQVFSAQPSRFADADLVEGGQCLVSRVERGRAIAGNPATATLMDGRRFFFVGKNQQDRFVRHPERYTDLPPPKPVTPQTTPSPAIAAATPPNPTTSNQEPPAAGEPPGGDAPSDTPASKADAPLVATQFPDRLGGYCPVTIIDEGVWARGRPDQRAHLGELSFACVGVLEKEAFLEDPARYIPVLAGDCPVTWVDQRRHVPGSVYYPAQVGSRFFLFAGAKEKEAFRQNPQRYLDVDLAAEGNCVVTLRDKEQTVAGDPVHAYWYQGWRYYFAGERERELFLRNPSYYAVAAKAALFSAPADSPGDQK
jgi:YHS domain-containing protein